MIYFDIESKRQENGLWGTPLRLKSMRIDCPYPKGEKERILNAIIVSIDENLKMDFTVKVYDKMFVLTTEKESFTYVYDNWGLIDSRLYYLRDKDTKKMFERIMKLKQIRNVRQEIDTRKN